MHVYDFTRAIVREPGRSVVNGLRDDPRAVPSYEGVLAEHRAYVAALRAAGLAVDVLAPLDAFPDSVFVEDPALVFPEGAILLRPGAPSRFGEREDMRGALKRHFDRVLELGEGGTVDGGDVLVTAKSVFIGLSKRTDRAGAEALSLLLRELGREARVVAVPAGALHLKSVSALLDDDTLIATPEVAQGGTFSGFEVVVPPPGEEAAANILRVNATVLVGAHYPRTADLLAGRGFAIKVLASREIAMLDAGFPCLSLRWHGLQAPPAPRSASRADHTLES